MLFLILAHRHMRRLVEEDVGRLQNGIGIEPQGRALAVLAGLLLELGHAVEPAQGRNTVEHPGELGMAGNVALHEEDRALGIDPAGEQCCCHLARIRAHRFGIVDRGERVLIDDAIDALEAVLQPHPRRMAPR